MQVILYDSHKLARQRKLARNPKIYSGRGKEAHSHGAIALIFLCARKEAGELADLVT